MTTQLKSYWEKEYENTATQFDIERPDRWIEELEQQSKIKGNILDSGCGPGRTALYLAKRGYHVIGVDISNNAIERAKEKANSENLKNIVFQQADVTLFSDYHHYFDTIIDIGCFHSLPQATDQRNYSKMLAQSCRKNARIYLRAFSDRNLENKKHPKGVPAISRTEIENTFSLSYGWFIKQLEEKEIQLLVANGQHKKGYCWFAEIQKTSNN